MIIFGEYDKLIPRENLLVYNLTSYIEGFERIDILPPFDIPYIDRNFDICYFNYIFNNDNIFTEFMKIIMALYYGFDVYILVSKDEGQMYDSISESIQKIIQQRYGILSNEINDIEDWDYLEESEFTIQGLYNLDCDKQRYSLLTFDPNQKIQ